MRCFNAKFIEIKNSGFYFITFIKWLLFSALVGVSGGIIGFCFSKLIQIVTEIRTKNDWLIFFLPIGGLIIVGVYSLFKVSLMGTDDIFETVRSDRKVSPLLLPAIFICSVITHLFGGSAGREGAAIQIGGSMATIFNKIFKMDEKNRHILVLCGISALFSAVFTTPLTATIFAIEVISVGYLYSSAVFPCLISSITAYYVSVALGTVPERFLLSKIPDFNLKTLTAIIIISILGAFISIIFCKTMHTVAHLFEKLKNRYIRIMVGGALIIILSLIFSSGDYNGGGMNIVEEIFSHSTVKYEAFLLKILFTAITIGAGYKGGEIVPTIFIGATFGAVVASILGISMPFGAALGVATLFSGVTNCPIASLFLCIELFGANGLLYFAFSTFISFFLSGYSSLFTGQKIIFSKLCDEKIEINAK